MISLTPMKPQLLRYDMTTICLLLQNLGMYKKSQRLQRDTMMICLLLQNLVMNTLQLTSSPGLL